MIDVAKLSDDQLMSGAAVARGTADNPAAILLSYAKPQAMRSATLFVHGAKVMFGGPSVSAVLEAETPGGDWTKDGEFTMAEVPTTISFAPVSASRFRLVLKPLPFQMANLGAPAPGVDLGAMAALGATMGGNAPLDVRHFTLSGEPRVDDAETKAGFALTNDYFSLPTPGDNAAGAAAAEVIDLTAKLKPDGSLDWKAPKGNWRVFRLGWPLLGTTNYSAPPEAT